MTPFQQALLQIEAGTLKQPDVWYEGKKVNYITYQLLVHKFNLQLLAHGLRIRGLKLKDLKAYYGLKGRSANDCFQEFKELVKNYQLRSENN